MNKLAHIILQTTTLVVFVGLVILLFMTSNANALVWTLIIPFVPLVLIIIGYSRWRNICPLAWFSKLTQNINIFGKRKLPIWFENNVYLFQFSILLVAFAARLFILNFNAQLLADFFILVIAIAVLSGLFLSGKTWCNFLCPVGIVEKIYSGSNAHMYHVDSACNTCTACKKNCPDIDLESAYWKESDSFQKRLIFYAFPGLVFGFYFYYFLESGTWDYYFSGEWAFDKDTLTLSAALMLPGFYFLPIVPKLFAVPITLILTSLTSYYLFRVFEKLIYLTSLVEEKDAKAIGHITNMFAAFAAFNIFYLFAGAPTFQHFPSFYAALHFIVITLSAVLLWKEIHREEKYFIQERFARKILKKWKGHEIPTKNLKEIYYTYANQQKDHEQHLNNYKETIFELMSDGVLTQESIKMLDKMRNQLGITPHEHKTILSSLEKEHSELFEKHSSVTAEKLFQLKSYKQMLQKMIDEKKAINESELESLRKHFQIDESEHEKIINELLNSEELIREKIFDQSKELVILQRLNSLIVSDKSVQIDYLKFSVEHLIVSEKKKLETYLSLTPEDGKLSKLIRSLLAEEINFDGMVECEEKFYAIIKEIDFYQSKNISENSADSLKEAAFLIFQNQLMPLIAPLLLVLSSENIMDAFNTEIARYKDCEDARIVELVNMNQEAMSSHGRVQKEALLHAVELFSSLSPDVIEMVAENIAYQGFKNGEFLVRQGEEGDSLYILSHGDAAVLVDKDGNVTKVAEVHENEYIGEIALFSGEKRTASVQAIGDVEALVLSADTLKNIIHYNPAISFDLMRQITQRLIHQKRA